MEHSSANPLVSVIMITYNQEQYIDEAIRGVIMQQVDFPYELIVANDASTDNTASHVKKWADRYPDIIRFIDRPKNLGLQLNYLDAFSKCKGKYIAICEGDDWWCSRHKLSIQAKYMERPCGMLCVLSPSGELLCRYPDNEPEQWRPKVGLNSQRPV